MPGNRLYLKSDTSFNQNLDLQEKLANEINSSKCSKSNGGDANDSIIVIKKEHEEINLTEDNEDEEYSINYPNLDDPSSDDDDDADVKDFFSENAKNPDFNRLPYTFSEDEEIINFVFKGSNLYKTTSILLWKYLSAKKKNPVRTYQSLKNRFMRNIKPNLLTVYRHLIPDEESLKKLFYKFPDLKKTYKNRPLNLPPRASLMIKKGKKVDAPKKPVKSPLPERSSSQMEHNEIRSEVGGNVNVTKEVHMKNKILIVTVFYKEKSQSIHGRGIYETYLYHKSRNKVDPCPTCGGSGFLNLNEEESNHVEKTSTRTEAERRENVETPAKKNRSTNSEITLSDKEENMLESSSMLNKSIGGEIVGNDDSDRTKDDLEDDLRITSFRTPRKRSRAEKGNSDFSTTDPPSKEEEDVQITSMILRKRKVLKKEVESPPH